MRKENASFNTKFISESGSYLINADYFAFVELKDYACYVIADGIDADEKKESAKLAVTTVISKFSDSPGMSSGRLKQYMKAAHQALLSEADEIRLEASIVIMLTDYKKAMWGHAGNCRLYWMKNGGIKLATRDTSLTQKMVDNEEVPVDQLAYHEERNNLYTYLGQPGRFTPVISKKRKLEDGDIFILQTHGVWENVGEAELLDAVDGVSKAEEVCTGLEDVILSQRLNTIENYTIATIFVDKIYNNPKAGKYKKWIKLGISLAVALCMVGVMMLFMQYRKNKSNLAKMEKSKESGIEYLQENNYLSADEQFTAAYEAAENVKAREHSENHKKVTCVELYDKMSEDLRLAGEALKETEYKKAAGLYQSAIDITATLKEEYGEDITGYLEGIKKYQSYADNMNRGSAALQSEEYEAAIENFTAASQQMDAIDDTTNRNTADDALKNTNSKKAMRDGAAFETKGGELLDQGVYSQALTQYQSARDAYALAKDTYGNADAADKISLIDIKIKNVEDMMSKLSNQDKEKEADGYLNMASEAAHDGKYEEAVKYYEDAKAIFQETGNTDQIIAINDKIDNVQYGPDEENALTCLMDALGAMARGDNASALTFLQKAMDAYTKLNNLERANEIQTVISSMGVG